MRRSSTHYTQTSTKNSYSETWESNLNIWDSQAIKSFEEPEKFAKRAMVRRLPIRRKGPLAHSSQRVRLLRKRGRMQRTHLQRRASTLPHIETSCLKRSPSTQAQHTKTPKDTITAPSKPDSHRCREL